MSASLKPMTGIDALPSAIGHDKANRRDQGEVRSSVRAGSPALVTFEGRGWS